MGVFPKRIRSFAVCGFCNSRVQMPPGIMYAGVAAHRTCALIEAEHDHTDAVTGPINDAIEEMLDEALDVSNVRIDTE